MPRSFRAHLESAYLKADSSVRTGQRPTLGTKALLLACG